MGYIGEEPFLFCSCSFGQFLFVDLKKTSHLLTSSLISFYQLAWHTSSQHLQKNDLLVVPTEAGLFSWLVPSDLWCPPSAFDSWKGYFRENAFYMLSALLFLTLINYRDVAHDFLGFLSCMLAATTATPLQVCWCCSAWLVYFCKVRINLGSLLPNCDLLCKF